MRHPILITAILGLLLAVVASPSSAQVATDSPTASRQQKLKQIRALKETLDEARKKLAAIEESLERDQAAESGKAGQDDMKQLESTASELRDQVSEGADSLNAALAEFINDNAPAEGDPVTADVQEAQDIKALADVAIAQEYIDGGGEYDRAIQILEAVLAYNPGNPEASAALDHARKWRYVTAERFARVDEGMSMGEVREILGAVSSQNLRALEAGQRIAWYYPKGPDGSAAAVYFCGEKGSRRVCGSEFEAVEARP